MMRSRRICGRRSVLGGLPNRASPPSDATPITAFSSVLRGAFPTSGTLGHGTLQPKPEDPAEPRPWPIASTTDPGREAPGAFHRRMLFPPLARNRSPPPISRLGRLDPASDTPSPASLEGRLDARPPWAHHPRVSDAKRRSSTSAIDTIHEHDRWIGGNLGLSCSRTSLERSRTECASLAGGRSRVASGQGPRTVARATRPLPTRLLASGALPRPDWPGHLMSRSLVVPRVWSTLGGAESRPLVAPSRASARLLGRGASYEAPRRDLVFRAPEVPSVAGPPRERMGLVHSLSPDCGEPAKRFFNLPRRPARLDSRVVLCRLDSKRSKLCFCEDPR
jgi:hypothetical protein